MTRVGISELGYSAYQEGGHYRGITVDLVHELERRTGCNFMISWFPRGRLFAQFESASIDIAMPTRRNAERDRYASWIPYTYTRFELVLNRRAGAPYRNLAEFVEQGVGRLNLVRGIGYPEQTVALLNALERAGRLEYVADYAVAFRKIQLGRADGTLAPSVVYAMHLRQLGMARQVQILPVTESPRAIVGAYLSQQTLPRPVREYYARTLYAIVADGTLQRYHEPYLGRAMTRELFSGDVHEILAAFPQ